MGHGKETPRQKMIGLMYLFLTAMLALNVSKEVLNSFILVGDSLEKTINNYKSKNEKVYSEFSKAYELNKEKVGPWKEKADQVQKKSEELISALEKHKVDLTIYAEGEESKAIVDGKFVINLLEQKDNIDKGGEYFGELGKNHGSVIEKQIDEYRELLLSVIPTTQVELTKTVETTLATEEHIDNEGIKHSWVESTFQHIPLIADYVMLAKLQTDVKNMETDAINYLFAQISAGDFKVNKIDATVIANSNYIMTGGEYKAEIFIAASDSTQDPEIYVGNFKDLGGGKYEIPANAEKLQVVNGKGIYTQSGKVVGEKKWGGLIKLKTPEGGESFFPFKTEYQVAQSTVVVSPTKMNVVYFGIDNPIEVSVPGMPASAITPKITSGASIVKAEQGYLVKPTVQKGKITIEVYATVDGKPKLMGNSEFRVRTVPPPVAKVMGQKSGEISKAMLTNAPNVYAELEDFLFELKFEITGFQIVSQDGIYTKEIKAKGAKFSSEQKEAIAAAKKGSRITIEEIEAKAPDGRLLTLSPIVFKLK